MDDDGDDEVLLSADCHPSIRRSKIGANRCNNLCNFKLFLRSRFPGQFLQCFDDGVFLLLWAVYFVPEKGSIALKTASASDPRGGRGPPP